MVNDIDKLIEQNKKLIEQNTQLIKEVNELKITCGRMDNHITFVENTYSILRLPLNWFIRKWYQMYGFVGFKRPLLNDLKSDNTYTNNPNVVKFDKNGIG